MTLQDADSLERAIRSGRLLPQMTFRQKVWALTARIPPGRVATYGDIARQLNSHAYRAVGRALRDNPWAPQVPCHRVVGSNGQLTGFAGGLSQKARLLRAEGIRVVAGCVDLDKVRFRAWQSVSCPAIFPPTAENSTTCP